MVGIRRLFVVSEPPLLIGKGNLLLNSSTKSELEIRYAKGDFVSFVVAECYSDFDYFVGKNNRRSVKRMVSLVPHFPPPTEISESILAPVFAIQVTIFPNKGICIGFTWRHVVCDASGIVGFTKAWASIYKHGSDFTFLSSGTLPSYDRSLVPEFKVLCQTMKIQQENAIGLKDFETSKVDFSEIPNYMVRSSFVLSLSNIQILKSILLAKHPTLGHVSAFVVTTGFFWSCLEKMHAKIGEETFEDQTVGLLIVVDCRARLDPPLPKSYFGNCVAPCFARIKHRELLCEEGFINGAKTIGEAITDFVNSGDGLLKGIENFMSDLFKLQRTFGITGSPKFSRYDVDFGWGKPEKVDNGFHTDAISVDKSPDLEGGLEIGLSLPSSKMDAFTVIFADNLKSLQIT